jgi:hypothetical protein
MFNDAFAHTQREIEAAMGRVALLEVFHDTQRVDVVIEAEAMPLQTFVQRTLSCMAEWRMPDIMDKRKRFGQIFIEAERTGHVTRDLLDFYGVSQPAAKVVGGAAGENLGLPGQPPEGARLHDSVPVARKRTPATPLGRSVYAAAQQIVTVCGDRAVAQIRMLAAVRGHTQSVSR